MPDRPRLLDLFCGAGGAAMGYSRAGFDVVGVDNRAQPRYPFAFVQADALEYVAEHGAEFEAVHASPPCQAYSAMRNLPWLRGREYWDSIPPTLAALRAAGRPWVLENVERSPVDGITLCGAMFGLILWDGSPLYRHRRFASSVFMLAPGHVRHPRGLAVDPGRLLGNRARRLAGVGTAAEKWAGFDRAIAGKAKSADDARHWGGALGIDWMKPPELSQAIPPAYTEFVGGQLIATL